MTFLIYFFIFVFGTIFGSFLNCVIYRLEKEESFFEGRSYCPHCKHELSFEDLIPIFSFFILKGKCRYCSQKISWQYPLVELSTGILFSLISIAIATNLSEFLFLAIISSFLIIIFVYDLKHYIIPDKIIYPAIGTAFLYQIISNFQFPISITNFQFQITNFYFSILTAFGAAVFFLTIVLISREKWLGFGDFKLAIFLGLFLGWPKIIVAFFLAFLIGAIVGVALIILGKKTLKSEIPFGPFLVTGTFLAMFFGQKLIDTYFNLFLL